MKNIWKYVWCALHPAEGSEPPMIYPNGYGCIHVSKLQALHGSTTLMIKFRDELEGKLSED